jgi:tryptophan halogenase
VALGDAAVQLEPLCGFAADLAHHQLDLLLELLPGREIHPLERAEFNRRAELMADRARDVLAAHCHAPSMRAFSEMVLSDELQLALEQFTRRGRVPFFEESPLLTQECASMLGALGYELGEGAMALAADMREMESEARAFADRADAALRAAPPYREWLGKVLSAPA